jgi:hypothetical protein
MDLSRERVHRLIDQLIDQLSEQDLQEVWAVLINLYYDLYLLDAIQHAKRSLQPGDTLTREEAMRFLSLL